MLVSEGDVKVVVAVVSLMTYFVAPKEESGAVSKIVPLCFFFRDRGLVGYAAGKCCVSIAFYGLFHL